MKEIAQKARRGEEEQEPSVNLCSLPFLHLSKFCISQPDLGRPGKTPSPEGNVLCNSQCSPSHVEAAPVGESGSFDLCSFFATLCDAAFHLMAQSPFLQLSDIKKQTPCSKNSHPGCVSVFLPVLSCYGAWGWRTLGSTTQTACSVPDTGSRFCRQPCCLPSGLGRSFSFLELLFPVIEEITSMNRKIYRGFQDPIFCLAFVKFISCP